MSDQAASFVGNIPEHYARGLGPVFFVDFAEEMAHRVAAYGPRRVLETSAGTGIVTRRLRDVLPPQTELVATDLNPPMLEVARAKFAGGERIDFQPPTRPRCPSPTGRSTRLSASSASCSFRTRTNPTARHTGSCTQAATTCSASGTRIASTRCRASYMRCWASISRTTRRASMRCRSPTAASTRSRRQRRKPASPTLPPPCSISIRPSPT
jgi:hypothetical protein